METGFFYEISQKSKRCLQRAGLCNSEEKSTLSSILMMPLEFCKIVPQEDVLKCIFLYVSIFLNLAILFETLYISTSIKIHRKTPGEDDFFPHSLVLVAFRIRRVQRMLQTRLVVALPSPKIVQNRVLPATVRYEQDGRKGKSGQTWWYVPFYPRQSSGGRRRRNLCEFELSLVYT